MLETNEPYALGYGPLVLFGILIYLLSVDQMPNMGPHFSPHPHQEEEENGPNQGHMHGTCEWSHTGRSNMTPVWETEA